MIYASKEYIGPVREKWTLIVDAKRPHLNAHAEASSEARGLNLGLSLHLHLCFAHASKKALACLRINAGSPELPLFDNAISTVLTGNPMCSLNTVMCTRLTAPAVCVRTSGNITLSLLVATFCRVL